MICYNIMLIILYDDDNDNDEKKTRSLIKMMSLVRIKLYRELRVKKILAKVIMIYLIMECLPSYYSTYFN